MVFYIGSAARVGQKVARFYLINQTLLITFNIHQTHVAAQRQRDNEISRRFNPNNCSESQWTKLLHRL